MTGPKTFHNFDGMRACIAGYGEPPSATLRASPCNG